MQCYIGLVCRKLNLSSLGKEYFCLDVETFKAWSVISSEDILVIYFNSSKINKKFQ